MICQASIVQLVNFIAILQLLAGLCLLFFYQDLLEKVAVTPARTRCVDNLNLIMNYLQPEFADHDVNSIKALLDCKSTEEGLHTIPTLRHAISYSGKLAFVFLLVLMVVASHEIVGEESPICYGWLFVSTATFIFFVIWSLIHREDKKYDRYWNFIVSAVILCGIVLMTALLPFEMPFSKTWTTYIILFSLFICVSIIISFFLFDEWRAEKLNQNIEQLRDAVTSYGNWIVSPNDRQRFFTIKPSLRALLSPSALQEECVGIVEKYVEIRIRALKEQYDGYNILFHDSIGIFKTARRNADVALRHLLALAFAFLLVTTYIVEIIQLFKALH